MTPPASPTNVDPASRSKSPSNTSTESTDSSIKLSACRIAFTCFLTLITLGGYLACRSYQLHTALITGKIEEAKEAIENGGWWVYQHLIGSDDFRSLALTKEIDSIRLIAAQILFDPNSATGKSSAANAYIVARDQNVIGYEQLKILQEILPHTALHPTKIDPRFAGITETNERVFIQTPVEPIEKPELDTDTERYLGNMLFPQGELAYAHAEDFINSMFEKHPTWERTPLTWAPNPKTKQLEPATWEDNPESKAYYTTLLTDFYNTTTTSIVPIPWHGKDRVNLS